MHVFLDAKPPAIDAIALTSKDILVGFTGGDCIQHSVLSNITTNDTSYIFTVTGNDTYIFGLTSFDYLHRIINTSTFYRLKCELIL